MPRLLRLTDVGLFTRNAKLSREFYVKKLGMTVRESMPKMGYLQLGTTKGGRDAGLDVWQPAKDWDEEMYREGMRSVGSVTGIGYATGDLARTVEALSRKGVKIERADEGFARFWDPDGNVSFVTQQERPKVRRSGLRRLEWMTVACRDAERVGRFLTGSLGLKAKTVRGGEGEGDFRIYRVRPDQTSIMPFTPERGMYDNPADFEADMEHIGEDTTIAFEVDDIHALQAKLLAKGVRFHHAAETQAWGGISAKVYDPDGNRYMLYEAR